MQVKIYLFLQIQINSDKDMAHFLDFHTNLTLTIEVV